MKSFEEKLGRLEDISRRINQDCPLEEALGLFEEGIELSRGLEKELSRIERKVEILVNSPDVEAVADADTVADAESADAGVSGSAPRSAGVKKEKPALDLFPDLEE